MPNIFLKTKFSSNKRFFIYKFTSDYYLPIITKIVHNLEMLIPEEKLRKTNPYPHVLPTPMQNILNNREYFENEATLK